MEQKNKKRNTILIIFLVLSAGLLIGSLLYLSRNHFEDEYRYTPPANSSQENVYENEVTIVNQSEKEDLQYLIEEEKLAYDVYTVFYNEFGSRVFGNILKSEATHQNKVLEVMNTKNIEDPRNAEAGVFSDKSLQTLYDSLIAQGLKSATEAIRVGVLIEEKDIADLTLMIENTDDTDIVAMYEELKKGSENHLVAFNKQLQ